jgi:hypothetical protein
MPDAPGRDNDDRPTKVIGKVRFRCDAPGASNLHLTVSVQRQNSGGTWVNLAQLTFTARGADTIRAGTGFQSRQVAAACSQGAFRTFVSGTSTARGSTKTYERAGPRSFDPCRPGLFAER